MNKTELKKVINSEFGFATNKIVLLEAGQMYGRYDYILFEVCGVQYSMRYNWFDSVYTLRLFEGAGRVTA